MNFRVGATFRLFADSNGWTSCERSTSILEEIGLRKTCLSFVRANLYNTSYVDQIISDNHMEKVKATTLGSGLFSFLGHAHFFESVGIKVHRQLQALSDRGVTVVRSTVSQYLALAQKGNDIKE